MLKLYDLTGKDNLRFSPPCWNVKLCLLHKQISYKTIPVRFLEKHKIKFYKLLPILFKIIAHEIPNILEGDDIDY